MGELAMVEDGGRDIGDPASRSHRDTLVGCRRATQATTWPYGQNIHLRQFPDQNRPVDDHLRRPSANRLHQKLKLTPAKPQPKPTQAAAAPGEYDSSALP